MHLGHLSFSVVPQETQRSHATGLQSYTKLTLFVTCVIAGVDFVLRVYNSLYEAHQKDNVIHSV